MAVRVSDILFRAGGATLKRLQTLVSAGAGRTEVAHTLTRADVAPFTDSSGVTRNAAINTILLDWPSGLVDGGGNAIGGFLSEGGRANIIDNSDCEADIVGWATLGASTIARDNAQAFSKSWSCKVTTTNAANVGVSINQRAAPRHPATAGLTYTFSAWIYAGASAVGKTLQLEIDYYSSAPAFLGSFNTISGGLVLGWQRVTVSGLAPASTATAQTYIRTNTIEGVFDFWVDVPQFEQNATARPALATGTVALTRAADSLTAPFNSGPQDLTILVRLARARWADANGALGVSPGIFSFGAGTAPRIGAYFDPAARNIIATIDTATTDGTATVAIPAGNPTICIQYKNLTTGGQCSIDTGSASSGFGTTATAFSQFSSQVARIGRYDDELYGVIGDLVVARGLFTRTEMMAVL